MELLTGILVVGLIIFTLGNINYHYNFKKIDPQGANVIKIEFYRNTIISVLILCALFFPDPLLVDLLLLFFIAIGIAIYFQYKLHRKYRHLVNNHQKYQQLQSIRKNKVSRQANKNIGVVAFVIGTITLVGVILRANSYEHQFYSSLDEQRLLFIILIVAAIVIIFGIIHIINSPKDRFENKAAPPQFKNNFSSVNVKKDNFCGTCGNKINATAQKYCMNCGAALD